jgi:diguanylate cyclase (GGDEF)-like protein
MPGIDGFETCRRLKASPDTKDIPVIFMTALSDTEDVVRGFEAGGVDYVAKPIQHEEVVARVMAHLTIRRLHERLERLSVTDDVTGFHNTRFLHQHLDELLARPAGAERPVSLVFFDMDGFKGLVDKHGHLLGSKALREVAETVNRHLDPQDRIVRYGGDEYVVILPDQGRAAALAKVERIRSALATTSYLREETGGVSLTASFGLATYPDDAPDKEGLLAAADRCLFRSKGRGKNTISVTERA